VHLTNFDIAAGGDAIKDDAAIVKSEQQD